MVLFWELPTTAADGLRSRTVQINAINNGAVVEVTGWLTHDPTAFNLKPSDYRDYPRNWSGHICFRSSTKADRVITIGNV